MRRCSHHIKPSWPQAAKNEDTFSYQVISRSSQNEDTRHSNGMHSCQARLLNSTHRDCHRQRMNLCVGFHNFRTHETTIRLQFQNESWESDASGNNEECKWIKVDLPSPIFQFVSDLRMASWPRPCIKLSVRVLGNKSKKELQMVHYGQEPTEQEIEYKPSSSVVD